MYFQQGIDIVEIRRISKIYEKFGINFLIKVLTKQELKIVPTQKKRRIDFLSGRFAAKEAIAKALGSGFRNGLSFKKISVINDIYGKPEIILERNINELLKKKTRDFNILVSISHEKKYCIASVTIIGEKK
jgi:holo-[acyl-carrier protein] synthase